ncbi:MAG: helix-turn-helix transcriptional regulator [Candidatus Thorarchaeota archaeon]|nr:MAG: helix-turn-helix transcriptional regulator [Candidatus Thorarchaeota archaeon]
MRKDDLKRFILRTFGLREFYGYEAHRELGSHGHTLGMSRLYSVLGEMLSEGLLEDRWEESMSGPRKRVYRLTAKGEQERKRILLEAIGIVHDFYVEYLTNLPPESSVFVKISKKLIKSSKSVSIIACVARRLSSPVKELLTNLCTTLPDCETYFIAQMAPDDDDIPTGCKFLNGSSDDIPFKENYIDLIIVIGGLGEEKLADCITEARRALRNNGTIALMIPTALVQEYEDPLHIGMFIERLEHKLPEGKKALDQESVVTALEKEFKKVEVKPIVHITVFTATGVT